MTHAINYSTLYPNDTTFYFHDGQSVTLCVSFSSYIMPFGVSINNYYGFTIILITINNNITLKMSTSLLSLGGLNVLKKCFIVVVDLELYCTLVIYEIEVEY